MTKKDQFDSFELMVMLTLMRLGDTAYGVPICDELEKRIGRDVAIGSGGRAQEKAAAASGEAGRKPFPDHWL